MQEKVKGAVKSYIELFPTEYAAFKKGILEKRKMLYDKKFGSTDGNHVVERALHDIPETLSAAIYSNLTPEEYVEFTTIAGSRWFSKTFPQFRVPDEI